MIETNYHINLPREPYDNAAERDLQVTKINYTLFNNYMTKYKLTQFVLVTCECNDPNHLFNISNQ